jgi:hypothetical protein
MERQPFDLHDRPSYSDWVIETPVVETDAGE